MKYYTVLAELRGKGEYFLGICAVTRITSRSGASCPAGCDVPLCSRGSWECGNRPFPPLPCFDLHQAAQTHSASSRAASHAGGCRQRGQTGLVNTCGASTGPRWRKVAGRHMSVENEKLVCDLVHSQHSNAKVGTEEHQFPSICLCQ